MAESAIACHVCFKWMMPDKAVWRVLPGQKIPVPVHEKCYEAAIGDKGGKEPMRITEQSYERRCEPLYDNFGNNPDTELTIYLTVKVIIPQGASLDAAISMAHKAMETELRRHREAE